MQAGGERTQMSLPPSPITLLAAPASAAVGAPSGPPLVTALIRLDLKRPLVLLPYTQHQLPASGHLPPPESL